MIDLASTVPLWRDSMSDAEWGPERPPLVGHRAADVAIVGAGYSALWTAHYLQLLDPSLQIVLLEAEEVGHGASGRNGGWCSAEMPMGLGGVARTHGAAGAIRLQRALHETVDEVCRVVATEHIQCDLATGGAITLARSPAQLARAREHVDEARRLGLGDDHVALLDADAARAAFAATNVLGALRTRQVAALHPARLVRGLARMVERRGAVIHERSRVTEIGERYLRTHGGVLEARVVVRATEAFTAELPHLRRRLTPIHSLMIATEPLPDTTWREIGLDDRSTFNDLRHLVIYGQRTADGRIAFGGRGARYHWASSLDPRHDVHRPTHELLVRTLRELLPATADARITHRWGGAVAAPRDWWCHVDFDRSTGHATLGGYVGEGVAASNLAGRALAHLITGVESPLTGLPFVGHRSPTWEPEPLRWIGVNAMISVTASADRHEQRTGRRSRWRERMIGAVTSGSLRPGIGRGRRRRTAR